MDRAALYLERSSTVRFWRSGSKTSLSVSVCDCFVRVSPCFCDAYVNEALYEYWDLNTKRSEDGAGVKDLLTVCW